MVDKKRVIVIAPFAKTADHHTVQYWGRHFNSYLKPLIEKVEGLEAVPSEPLTSDNVNQTISDLTNVDIVVVDLTDRDPNVLWELGVRQSFKNNTVIIAETETQIPFSFSQKGILYYNGEHLDNQIFEEKFQAALLNCTCASNEVDSPVLEITAKKAEVVEEVIEKPVYEPHKKRDARRVEALQLELSVNEILLGQIFDNCQKNKVIRESNSNEAKKMTTTPLKTFAIEFLLINRYLDFDKTFYSNIYAYHNYMNSINGHLVAWESTDTEKDVEEWLLACKESAYKHVNKLKEQLQQLK